MLVTCPEIATQIRWSLSEAPSKFTSQKQPRQFVEELKNGWFSRF
jgi:hypothetical protein